MAAPILNGAVGAKLAAKHNRPIGPAKWAATLAALLGIVATVLIAWSLLGLSSSITSGAVGNGFTQTGATETLFTVLIFLGPVAALYVLLRWAASKAGTKTPALVWTALFILLFGIAFVGEVVLGAGLILAGAWPAYFLVPLVVIPLAVALRYRMVTAAVHVQAAEATREEQQD